MPSKGYGDNQRDVDLVNDLVLDWEPGVGGFTGCYATSLAGF
jgi:hypothetical protein